MYSSGDRGKRCSGNTHAIGCEQPKTKEHADLNIDAMHEQAVEHVVDAEHDQASECASQHCSPEIVEPAFRTHQRTTKLAKRKP